MVSRSVAVLGLLLTAIGVFMPFWSVEVNGHLGVFVYCYWTFKQCISTQELDITYRGANLADLLWALSLSGISALLLSLVGIFGYPKDITEDHCGVWVSILVSVLISCGVALILAAVVVLGDYIVLLGVRVDILVNGLGWAWYLTIAGLVIFVFILICNIINLCALINGDANRVVPVSNSRTNDKTNNKTKDTRPFPNEIRNNDRHRQSDFIGQERPVRSSDFIGQERPMRSIRHSYVNRNLYDDEIFDIHNNRLF